jgi:hypothetical protein
VILLREQLAKLVNRLVLTKRTEMALSDRIGEGEGITPDQVNVGKARWGKALQVRWRNRGLYQHSCHG